MKVNIVLGACAPKLSEQLKGQFGKYLLKKLDLCASGIVTLHLEGVLSQSEVERARERLVKKIERALRSRRINDADAANAELEEPGHE